MERNKFLTKVMDKCWHEAKYSYRDYFGIDYECECGLRWSEEDEVPNLDFSTWEGFGKLLEFVISKTKDDDNYEEWAEQFLFTLQVTVLSIGYKIPIIPIKYINPDKFADTLYKFLKERKIYDDEREAG